MNTTDNVPSYPPVARTDQPERLDTLPPKTEVPADLWAEVHEAVQAELALLDSEVHRNLAAARGTAGQTSGERFYLHSYRTFSLPASSVDPVVAGLTFTPASEGVTLEADISGEQNGDVIVSLPRETVSGSREELLVAARMAARKLCKSGEAISAALRDASRQVE